MFSARTCWVSLIPARSSALIAAKTFGMNSPKNCAPWLPPKTSRLKWSKGG